MNNLTIRDIAKMAGVSPTTVSFVINNKDGVSKETIKKVQKIIEETNYRPNINSKRLSLKKSFNITIVINQTSSPFDDLFYLEISKGILKKSKEFGYNIVFTDIVSDKNKVTLPDIISFRDTDGIIFLQDTSKLITDEVKKLNIPYIIIDAHTFDNDFTCVNADYNEAAYKATRFLIENGHKDIGFISSSYISEFYIQTFTGMKKALEESGLSVQTSWLQLEAKDEETAYTSMKKILNAKTIPSAIFCSADIFAIGAMKYAKEKGYNIPEDISFIGIDDIFLSQYCEPNLTTIKINKEEMGIKAMELIMDKIKGKNPKSVLLQSDNLIIRKSVSKKQ